MVVGYINRQRSHWCRAMKGLVYIYLYPNYCLVRPLISVCQLPHHLLSLNTSSPKLGRVIQFHDLLYQPLSLFLLSFFFRFVVHMFLFFVIVKMIRANNINSTDARSNPSKQEMHVYYTERKPPAFVVEVPDKGWNLCRLMRTECLTFRLFLSSCHFCSFEPKVVRGASFNRVHGVSRFRLETIYVIIYVIYFPY